MGVAGSILKPHPCNFEKTCIFKLQKTQKPSSPGIQKFLNKATEADCEVSKSITANIVEEYAIDQARWVLDFAKVFDKMMANGYDINQLQVAEYECCTRNPPSKAKKPRKGSVVECDSSATC